jgi:60 kDa SS-A/Ro ribonucleoprotein
MVEQLGNPVHTGSHATEEIMASKSVFKNTGVPAANAKNEAGGIAYSMPAKESLAQLACTGCFQNTFYASAKDQLEKVKTLANSCDPDFISKLAIYSREQGFLKDMPAFLVAWLAGRVSDAHKRGATKEAEDINALLWETFPRVIDNGKMLKNFVQIIRSGETGRKSLGTAPQRLIKSWFDAKDDEGLFFQSVGNDPSIGDVVKLARPRPTTIHRAAMYAYFIGKEVGKFDGKDFITSVSLPETVAHFEAFKKEPLGDPPKVPFELLEGLPLSLDQWKALALRQSFSSLRQRLNTFSRKGVFGAEGKWDTETVKAVAEKLRDPEAIRKAKTLPYQIMITYLNMGPEMPREVTAALQDAMEVATENVPVIDGPVCVFPDISGSMHSPITGERINPKTGKREMHTTKVRCIDVAALVSASFLRTNPHAVIIPFESKALTNVRLNPRDTVMTNAEKLMRLPCGGTNCSAALNAVNQFGISPALCVYVSDNCSWVDSPYHASWGGTPTETLREWGIVKRRAPEAKLVCLDVQPLDTTQALSREDILNVGGFSDKVFDVMAAFVSGKSGSWLDVIEATE